jgi:hypothetical protein
MQHLAKEILSQASALPEGALITAKALLHLGSRAGIDQALKRLHERKELMRLSRGVYVRPIKTRFGTRAPTPEKVVMRLAATKAETIAKHGAAAANALGLTTQVPTKLVYLTSGPSRRLKLGAQVVEMQHAPQWMLFPSHHAAGGTVRALAWIGRQRAPEALKTLKRKLSPLTVEELVTIRSALPSWMSELIGRAFA